MIAGRGSRTRSSSRGGRKAADATIQAWVALPEAGRGDGARVPRIMVRPMPTPAARSVGRGSRGECSGRESRVVTRLAEVLCSIGGLDVGDERGMPTTTSERAVYARPAR